MQCSPRSPPEVNSCPNFAPIRFNLRDCLLTNQQLETLLAEVSQGHRLKVFHLDLKEQLFTHEEQVLNLAENDLSMVKTQLLAQTVVVLEEIDLTGSNLTVLQVGCMLTLEQVQITASKSNFSDSLSNL